MTCHSHLSSRVRGEMRAKQLVSNPRPKVLIVEDDVAVDKMLHISLRAAGFDIVDPGDGAEALNVLKQPGSADALIVDIGLPDGAGRTVLDRLRRMDKRDLPVCVVISALDRDEVAKRYGLLSRHFLAKPFDPWDLVRVVERLLSERDGGQRGWRRRHTRKRARPEADLAGRGRRNPVVNR